jgi:peptide/nickel transport system substrate-binding protein
MCLAGTIDKEKRVSPNAISRHRLLLLGVVVAAAALVTTSGINLHVATADGSHRADKPVAGGTLTIAATTPPVSLNPAINGSGVPLIWFDRLTYDPLIIRRPNNTSAPGLATSWKYLNDNKTFIIELRSGVKFSDGSPLNANAVVKWIEYFKANGTFGYTLSRLASVEASGPLEVTFNLSAPDPLLPYYLSQEGGGAGNVASDAAIASPQKMNTASFGAGEYILDSSATVQNATYVYTDNPRYWNPSAVHWKRVVIEVIANDNSSLAALQSGQVQVALGTATTAASAKSSDLVVTSRPAGWVGAILWDRAGTLVPALSDLKVRQALNYAIDRPEITNALYHGFGVATTQYDPNSGSYVKALDGHYPLDVSRAKQLLAQAGYPDGFSFKMLVQPGDPGASLLAQALVQDWAAINVRVALVSPVTFSAYASDGLSKEFPVSTGGSENNPFIYQMDTFFAPTGLYNVFGVSTPGLDALIDQTDAVPPDSVRGDQLGQKIMTIAVQQALSVPVADADRIVYSTQHIGGIAFSAAFPVPDPTDWYSLG